MKRLLSIAVISLVVLTTSSSALAANSVSQMAVVKGGQHVAECAQKMDKGISECVQMLECKN